jgi:hypothetical protein
MSQLVSQSTLKLSETESDVTFAARDNCDLEGMIVSFKMIKSEDQRQKFRSHKFLAVTLKGCKEKIRFTEMFCNK